MAYVSINAGYQYNDQLNTSANHRESVLPQLMAIENRYQYGEKAMAGYDESVEAVNRLLFS